MKFSVSVIICALFAVAYFAAHPVRPKVSNPLDWVVQEVPGDVSLVRDEDAFDGLKSGDSGERRGSSGSARRTASATDPSRSSDRRVAESPDRAMAGGGGPWSKLIRFDFKEADFADRAQRVSARLNETSYNAYRVSHSSGTRSTDFAGFLTYYFNKERQLAAIAVVGTVNDPDPLVAFLHQRFGFRMLSDRTKGVYRFRAQGATAGGLELTASDVFDEGDSLFHYHVQLVIERADAK